MQPGAAVLTLLSIAVISSTDGFFYQSTYQHQPVPTVYHQQAYLPLPLAIHGYQPQGYDPRFYSPPAYSIYSQPANLLQGYSYEMQDIAGGRSQVIYVAGPNSQQLFRQNAGALNIILPEFETRATVNKSVAEKPLSNLPQINYYSAEVIPHGQPLLGTVPLFAYSVNTDSPKQAENKTTSSSSSSSSSSGKEATPSSAPASDKDESSTAPPASEDSSSSAESESPKSPDSSDSSDSSKASSLEEEIQATTEDSQEPTTSPEKKED